MPNRAQNLLEFFARHMREKRQSCLFLRLSAQKQTSILKNPPIRL